MFVKCISGKWTASRPNLVDKNKIFSEVGKASFHGEDKILVDKEIHDSQIVLNPWTNKRVKCVKVEQITSKAKW